MRYPMNASYLCVLLIFGEAAAKDSDDFSHVLHMLLQNTQSSICLSQDQQVAGLDISVLATEKTRFNQT